jgi:hypothetical protein
MADIIQDIILRVSSDAEELRKGVGQVDDKVKETNKSAGGLQNQFKKLLPALGVAAIVAGFKKIATASIQAADVQAKAEAKVQQAIKSTQGVAGRTLDQLKQQAVDLQKSTLFGDEEILKGATATLLTFTKITGEQFDEAQKVVLDLSTAMGTDLQSASLQVGKALNDPILGVTALARSGIQFTQQQKDVIKSLAETGQMAEAQKMILQELNTQFGGQAAAAAKVGLGAFTQMKNIISDLSEVFGGFLLDALNPAINGIKSFASSVYDYVKTPLSETLEKERIGLNSLVFQITEANTSQEQRVKLIREIQSEYPNFLKNIDAEKVTNEQLIEQLKLANDEYLKKILLQRELEEKQKIQNNLIDATETKIQREEKLRQKLIKANEDYNLGIDFTNKKLEESANLVRDALYDVPFGNGALSARLLSDNIFALTGRIRGSNAEMASLNDELDNSTTKYQALQDELFGLGTNITEKSAGQKIGTDIVNGIVEGAEEAAKEVDTDGIAKDIQNALLESFKNNPLTDEEVLTMLGLSPEQIAGVKLAEVKVQLGLDTEESIDAINDWIEENKESINEVDFKPKVEVDIDEVGKGINQILGETKQLIESLGIAERIQKEIDEFDELIAKQQEVVDSTRSLAEQGNANQLKLEEERLAQLQAQQDAALKRKEKNAKAEIAINKSLALSQSIVAIASAAKEGAGALVLIPLIISALAAGISTVTSLTGGAFYEGTEDTGKGGRLDSKGGFAAILHPNERVMTAKQNKRIKKALGNVSNDDLVAMIENSKSLSVNPGGLLVDSSAINEKMNTKMDEMISLNREMLKAMKRNGVNVSIDRNGLSVMMHQMVQRQNILNSL